MSSPLPPNHTIRRVVDSDYESYVSTLQTLTSTGTVSLEAFTQLLAHWDVPGSMYHPHVIETEGTVVACGMLLVEQKLIHGCGSVGHIEDIAVAKTSQGQNLGRIMIERLTEAAEAAGCYKVILDCGDQNVGFYEKCGYTKENVGMARRF